MYNLIIFNTRIGDKNNGYQMEVLDCTDDL